ncbi:hypothetical protein GWI33_008920 [Rhynchophorus ferrugineus]|uniref:Inorganic phosphate cotransporter n=1 Tax=Rhynchophorus ferrugineus TaxID=354439 RepID=A0A834IVN1_RHYFE|nr:hypothetical protein GWI33_008920 [Rhynchophorus ferrugineus]
MSSISEKSPDAELETVNHGPRFGYRHVQVLLMFFLLAVGYAMRVNLSVGIVAMTTANSSSNPDIPLTHIIHILGTLVPALALAILGFIPKENIAVIECLLVIAVGVNAAVWCGFQVNHVDLSPKFSGILMGIGNGSSNIFSIISPNIVQAIVTDETDPAQWRTVFLIASAIYILSDIFFVIFAKADRQWWDNLGGDTTEVEDQFQEIKLEKES